MKRVLTCVIGLVLTMTAMPAFAENLGGHADFGACTVSPVSVKHVKPHAKKDRWVRIKATVSCSEEYAHGKLTFRTAGINSQGVAASPRDHESTAMKRPIKAKDRILKATLRCNVMKHGDWKYEKLQQKVWIFAQVYRGGTWYRTSVEDQTRSLTC